MPCSPRIAIATPLSAESAFIADSLSPEGFEPFRLTNQSRLLADLQENAFDLLVVDTTLRDTGHQCRARPESAHTNRRDRSC